jgi:hypothetical protein
MASNSYQAGKAARLDRIEQEHTCEWNLRMYNPSNKKLEEVHRTKAVNDAVDHLLVSWIGRF